VTVTIEVPEGRDALTDFVVFRDRVYEGRSARWPTLVDLELPALLGDGPFAEGRTVHPLVARDDGEIVARAAALVDQRYVDHWDDPLGHVVLFEAMPGTAEATSQLMNEACAWLRENGMQAARAGFGGGSDLPFAIDDYDTLPPMLVRHNPAYYHALLKDAGFESEKGWVDYKIAVRPELLERWTSALDSAERAGFAIVPLRDVPEEDRIGQFTAVWNEAFRSHWGVSPFTEGEFAQLLEFLGPMGMLDLSLLAFSGDEPVGVLWVTPEMSAIATLAPGRELRSDEKVNFLGIGVLEPARGRGVNLAMASYAYLELARRGAGHVSYTLVLDDNWPSRRTAEKLGASICANYMVYRRNFRRTSSTVL
jgi:GNAT superfamily N-acetyltransferase